MSLHAPNGVLGVNASVARQIVTIRSIPHTLEPTTTSWGGLKKNVLFFSSICNLRYLRFANLLCKTLRRCRSLRPYDRLLNNPVLRADYMYRAARAATVTRATPAEKVEAVP